MRVKTFVFTYVLFLTVFFSCLILISALFFRSQTGLDMNRAIREHYLISESMSQELLDMIRRGADPEAAMQYLYEYYAGRYAGQKGYIEIYQGDDLIYGNLEGFSFGPDLEAPLKGSIAVMKTSNGRNFVIVKGILQLINARLISDEHYEIQYICDITDTILVWKSMRNTSLWIGITFSSIIAVLLLFLLKLVFRPLDQIIEVSKEISDGHYEQRIHAGENDEVTALADHFNDMAEKVQSVIRELSEEAQQKQRFVDSFSHEIRTPLASVYGFAEYMQKSALREEEVIRIAGYIMEDSRHILNIADRLLDLAAFRNQSLIKVRCPADSLLESVAQTLRDLLEKNQICLLREIGVADLYGDEDLLKNLLINLTRNAIENSDPGGRVIWQIIREEEHTVLAVTDEGKGIPPEEIHKINEPFYRVDKSRSRKMGNVGLGLAICHQIADCHGARMVFLSELGQGTTVKVIFTTS